MRCLGGEIRRQRGFLCVGHGERKISRKIPGVGRRRRREESVKSQCKHSLRSASRLASFYRGRGGVAGWSSCLLPSLTHPPTFRGSGELGREGRKGCEGGKEIKELRRRPFLLCAQPKKTVVLTLACHAAMPLARENVPFFSSPHPPPVRRPEPQSAPPFSPAREQT